MRAISEECESYDVVNRLHYTHKWDSLVGLSSELPWSDCHVEYDLDVEVSHSEVINAIK